VYLNEKKAASSIRSVGNDPDFKAHQQKINDGSYDVETIVRVLSAYRTRIGIEIFIKKAESYSSSNPNILKIKSARACLEYYITKYATKGVHPERNAVCFESHFVYLSKLASMIKSDLAAKQRWIISAMVRDIIFLDLSAGSRNETYDYFDNESDVKHEYAAQNAMSIISVLAHHANLSNLSPLSFIVDLVDEALLSLYNLMTHFSSDVEGLCKCIYNMYKLIPLLLILLNVLAIYAQDYSSIVVTLFSAVVGTSSQWSSEAILVVTFITVLSYVLPKVLRLFGVRV